MSKLLICGIESQTRNQDLIGTVFQFQSMFFLGGGGGKNGEFRSPRTFFLLSRVGQSFERINSLVRKALKHKYRAVSWGSALPKLKIIGN